MFGSQGIPHAYIKFIHGDVIADHPQVLQNEGSGYLAAKVGPVSVGKYKGN